MALWQTKRHWEKFAEKDPFWAVLSHADKRGRKWTAEDFFATGESEVAAIMKRLKLHAPETRREAALDFGCGVGRLSQALAGHFQQVTGVDISSKMIALAQEHNRHGSRITYVHNTQDDLKTFPDNRFDFVCSLITLQHMDTIHAKSYIAEFARVCRPGGVVFFQMPDAIPPPRSRSFSWYPPTMLKRALKRLNRIIAVFPVMDMNAIPRSQILEILRQNGLRTLDVELHPEATGKIVSYFYLAIKAQA